tara:strand:+ start:3073 stop:3585 length:513 start_codon:yes stop_codon:yes gene_type:complete
MAWVNTITGDAQDLKPEDAGEEWVYIEFEEEANDEYVTTTYLKRKVGLEAELKALKAQYDKRVRSVKAEIRGLDYHCIDRLKAQAKRDLEGSKKKSVHYEYATVGWKKPRRIEVDNPEEVIEWALKHDYPDAVKIEMKRSLLKSNLPKDVEIPGVRRPKEDEFYIRLPKQ